MPKGSTPLSGVHNALAFTCGARSALSECNASGSSFRRGLTRGPGSYILGRARPGPVHRDGGTASFQGEGRTAGLLASLAAGNRMDSEFDPADWHSLSSPLAEEIAINVRNPSHRNQLDDCSGRGAAR